MGNFFGDLFSEGKEFAKDATGGIKLPSLQEIGQGFTNFMDRFRPQRTVTDTNAMNMPVIFLVRETYDYGDTTCRCYGTKYFWFNDGTLA